MLMYIKDHNGGETWVRTRLVAKIQKFDRYKDDLKELKLTYMDGSTDYFILEEEKLQSITTKLVLIENHPDWVKNN